MASIDRSDSRLNSCPSVRISDVLCVIYAALQQRAGVKSCDF